MAVKKPINSRIAGIISEAAAKNPQSEHILAAFKPLFLTRERLVGKLDVKTVDLESIDGEKLRRGVPCMHQIPFFFEDDPWEEIGLEVVSAMSAGFPALSDDIAKLDKKIRMGEIRLFDAYQDFPGGIETAIAHFSNGTGIKPQTAVLLLTAVTRILLEAKAEGISGRLNESVWEKGYCPVCGALPTIAVIREKITQCWLHCSQCGHDWRFSRLICPACGKGNQDGQDYFYLKDRNQETAFTCESCKRYLITLNHISDIGEHDRDVMAMSLVHLDFIMQGKGFIPMARSLWNAFNPANS